jgi:hypothetical protein
MYFGADSIELYLKPTGFERVIYVGGFAWIEIGKDWPIKKPQCHEEQAGCGSGLVVSYSETIVCSLLLAKFLENKFPRTADSSN